MPKVTEGCRGKHKGHASQRDGKLARDTAVSLRGYRSTDTGWFRAPFSREPTTRIDQRDFEDRWLSTFDFATYVFRGVYQLVLSGKPNLSIGLSVPSRIPNISLEPGTNPITRHRKSGLSQGKSVKSRLEAVVSYRTASTDANQ